MPNKQPKRQRPKSKQDRARVHVINGLLRNPRTPEARRAELQAEKDRLSPVIPVERPAHIPALAKWNAGLSAWEWTDGAGQHVVVTSDGKTLRTAPEKKKPFYDVPPATAPVEGLPKLEGRGRCGELQAKALEYFLMLPEKEQNRLRAVFEDAKKNPNWSSVVTFMDATEKEFSAKEPHGLNVSKADEPRAPLPVSKAGEPDPAAAVSTALADRVRIVLQSDSWLLHLVEHSPDKRTQVEAALADQLLRVGVISGDFAARLYNHLRPAAVPGFPPRVF